MYQYVWFYQKLRGCNRDADDGIPTPTRAPGRTGDFQNENLQGIQWRR